MSKSVCIITPTIGSPHLKQCVESVLKQTYNNVKHLVVVDGDDKNHQYSVNNNETIMSMLCKYRINQNTYMPRIEPILLRDNVGANGWYGHRIYAAFSYLVNEDYIVYLDEDNWIEPTHIEKLMHTVESLNYQWAWSLRNIVDKEGNFVCRDDCENLGMWANITGGNHIDTSCYFIKKELAVQVAHNWYGGWGADRQFFQSLQKCDPKFNIFSNYTLNYRLDGNPGSPKKEFFLQGNDIMKNHYKFHGNETSPWSTINAQI